MPITILTPICSSKAYAWHRYCKGVIDLKWDKKDILWLFVVQEQALEPQLTDQIAELQDRMGDQYLGIESVHYRLPFHDDIFDPRAAVATWQNRAFCAAHLRAVGFQAARELCPDFTHLLSLGCDVCLNNPQDLNRLLEMETPLASGVILARIRQFPLVLNYHPENPVDGFPWSPRPDYPRDQNFVADWTGMDILLLQRALTEQINLFDFNVEEFGLGEDGWFCLKARQLGVPTLVNPRVTPFHVHQGGVALWAEGEVWRSGWTIRCRRCGTERVVSASFCDSSSPCVTCRQIQSHYHWSEDLPPSAPLTGGALSGSFVSA